MEKNCRSGCGWKMELQRESHPRNIFKGRAAIVANGRLSAEILPQKLLERYEYVIGCDGGGAFLHEIGFLPDLLVGDFDSMKPELLQIFRENGRTEIADFPPEKDFTDLELAAALAIERGFSHLDLYGVTGSRLDHTFGNLMLLYQIRRMGGCGTVIDENNIIFAAENTVEISAGWAEAVFCKTAPGVRRTEEGIAADLGEEARNFREKLFVSLLLLTDCSGITLEGFRYPLMNYSGTYGSSLCISNELLEKRGRIRLGAGRLLVFISRD